MTIPIRNSTAAPRIPPTIPPIASPERPLVALCEIVPVETWLEFVDATVTAGLATEDVLVFISVVDELSSVL
jgi:hypothetical protein